MHARQDDDEGGCNTDGMTDDVLTFKPNPGIDCSQSVVRTLFIGDPSTGRRHGRHGIYLDQSHRRQRDCRQDAGHLRQ
jgi:hypothetical protein